MHAFRLLWERLAGHSPKHGIFGFDYEADVNSVQLLCSAIGVEELQDDVAAKLGLTLHYAYGAALGALYSVFAARRPWVRRGFGTAFGSVLWLIADELPISAAHVSRPFDRSGASHAGALASHLLFGATVDAFTREETTAE